MIATTRSSDKKDRLREVGANLAIATDSDDLAQTLLDAADDRGADIVINLLAGPRLNRILPGVGRGDRIVFLGALAGGSDVTRDY